MTDKTIAEELVSKRKEKASTTDPERHWQISFLVKYAVSNGTPRVGSLRRAPTTGTIAASWSRLQIRVRRYCRKFIKLWENVLTVLTRTLLLSWAPLFVIDKQMLQLYEEVDLFYCVFQAWWIQELDESCVQQIPASTRFVTASPEYRAFTSTHFARPHHPFFCFFPISLHPWILYQPSRSPLRWSASWSRTY